jgi:hypothetical protein
MVSRARDFFEFPNVLECSRKKMRDKSAKSLLRGLLS